MITEQALDRAIAECQQGAENYSTCQKMATFLTLKQHLYSEKQEAVQHSYSSGSSSDFMNAIKDKDVNTVYDVIDELLSTLEVINPRLYQGVLRRLTE